MIFPSMKSEHIKIAGKIATYRMAFRQYGISDHLETFNCNDGLTIAKLFFD